MLKTVKYLVIFCLKENNFKQFSTTVVYKSVDCLEIVESCPTSKTDLEWDSAALKKKNYSRVASRQNCINAREKFQYHCVINGLRNKLVEVCAPRRIIFSMYAVFMNIISYLFIQRSAELTFETVAWTKRGPRTKYISET